MISNLIALLVLVVVVVILFWLIDTVPLPPPANSIIKGIIAVIAIIDGDTLSRRVLALST
jgi:hypothetical protein